jgi:hypothetical protein
MTKGWTVDDFRVSRAVQAQLGWQTLDTVMSSAETMVTFQEEVFKQKLERERYLKGVTEKWAPHTILTERSFADISAYASNWAWQLVDDSKWTLPEAAQWTYRYRVKCLDAQAECYDGVVLIPLMDEIPWEDDPNRASRTTVNAIFEDIERFVGVSRFIAAPKLRVTKVTVAARINQVEAFLEQL